MERFRRIIDDLAASPLRPRLTLTGQGEPFLHRDLESMVEYAAEAGFHVSIITNGTMTTPERSSKLIEAGLSRIQFSFDSVDPEIYAEMRIQKCSGDKHYFQRALSNILNFAVLNHQAERPVHVSVMSVQTARNRSLADEFRAFWARYPIDNVFLAPLSTLQGNSMDSEAIALHYRGEMSAKPLCAIPWMVASYKVDGSVVACSHDYENRWPLGNIDDATFKELWVGPRAQELRQALLDGEVDAFVARGHDCKVCNNPLIGYSVETFLEGHAKAITRIEESMASSAPARPVEYRNALEELARLDLPSMAV